MTRGLCALALLLLCAASVHSQPVIDGVFDDWPDTGAHSTMTGQHAGANHALRRLDLQRHGPDLYLAFETGELVNLQAIDGSLVLLFDHDGESHGGRWGKRRGVDLALEFSPARALEDLPAHTGSRLLRWNGRRFDIDNGRAVGAVIQPTHASRRFEMRLDLASLTGQQVSGPALSADPDLRVAWGARDRRGRLVARGEWLAVPADAGGTRSHASAGNLPQKPAEGLRVLVWNVGERDLVRQPLRYASVLQATRPDLVLFDEVSGAVQASTLAQVFSGLPCPEPDQRWNWSLGSLGGRQRGLVAACAKLAVEKRISSLRYPVNAIRRALPTSTDHLGGDTASALIRAGMAFHGVRLDIQGRSLLVTTVDLYSRGSLGSPEEAVRELESRSLAQALREATKDRPVDGVLVGGDFNLVGGREPLEILLRESGVGLKATEPRALDGSDTITWRAPRGGAFLPGRLDYLLHSDALEPVQAFVFETARMSDALLQSLGLAREDSDRTTDHLPLIVDFLLSDSGSQAGVN